MGYLLYQLVHLWLWLQSWTHQKLPIITARHRGEFALPLIWLEASRHRSSSSQWTLSSLQKNEQNVTSHPNKYVQVKGSQDLIGYDTILNHTETEIHASWKEIQSSFVSTNASSLKNINWYEPLWHQPVPLETPPQHVVIVMDQYNICIYIPTHQGV